MLTDSDLVKLDGARSGSGSRWAAKKEWIDRAITVGTILVSVVWYTSRLEQRIALREQADAVQRERDERQDRAFAEAMALWRQQADKFEAKLDRVLDARKP